MRHGDISLRTDQKVIRLSEYEPYGWRMNETKLKFRLFDDGSFVDSDLRFEVDGATSNSIRLDGEHLELESIAVDGRELSNNEYSVDTEGLTIFDVPESFALSITTKIHPETNTTLEGLYKSSNLFCTQCEAESFRRMTYYPDRPDVSSIFTTTIEADKSKFPNLLSNGNLIHEEDLPEGRHSATWHDPFRKPSYLFALVAGNLAALEDEFVTCSGRTVRLTIYTEHKYKDRCVWAMDCLKRSMKWDEEAYGREYDLDRFMIVAVDDFNFGAMENKGLNIFNASALLADPDTTTDGAYERIEGIIAHEYFHNWSGNRVTCRDWFQLSLKEGFTVFRDTQFSESTVGATAKRIQTVAGLQAAQFPEDASALAHPVRPDRYTAITNFYTATIYQKGAEVLRMMHTMAGKERWRKSTDLYFDRHDGQAVTIEDFARAVSDASGLDLSQFFRWYVQAGTPRLTVSETQDDGSMNLEIAQRCEPTPNQPHKEPFHIPLAIGLIDSKGREVLGQTGKQNGYDISCRSDMHVENPNEDGTLIVHLKNTKDSIEFQGIPQGATVSFLRGFSAPVYVDYPQSVDQLEMLAAHDSDGFTKWNAMRSIYGRFILNRSVELGRVAELTTCVVDQLQDCENGRERKSLLNAMLQPPSVFNVLDANPGADFDDIVINRDELSQFLADQLLQLWEELYVQHPAEPSYETTRAAVNRRATRHAALAYLRRGMGKKHPESIGNLLRDNFNNADNLTDRLANFVQLLELPDQVQRTKQEVIDEFYSRFEHEAFVVNNWFSCQIMCTLPGAIDRVKLLEKHEAFNKTNPNRVRSVYGAFTSNYKNFHDLSGEGYQYLAEKIIELETTNPQVSARLATVLTRWNRFGPKRRALMQDALRSIAGTMQSKDLSDVVNRGLKVDL
ncbi:MAG: aminopeptidase N [Gammaproteobacteria bacterium]|nr:aminopeptidase N [Gammaproteobacteria bacterium]